MMFSMCLLLVISLFGLLGGGYGDIIQSGQCDPNLALATNFDINNFVGTWYEIQASDDLSGDCSSYYVENQDGAFTVTRTSVNQNFEVTQTGSIVQTENEPSRLTFNWGTSSADFWVLLTDETQSLFALAYSCVQISPEERSMSVWVIGREAAPLTPILTSLVTTTLASSLGVDINELREVSHSEDSCYILPIIEPGQPIVLPGQCNPNINVVQDFRVADFTGLWHEVASYESENSQNQCTRAEYTLDGGVVNVLNSQVVNQALDTISGTAAVASDDGSARLDVILNVGTGTVSQSLYILATDYENYAVSYTCVDLTENTRRVYSWVLSRTRQLSEEAQAAVNEVIASEIDLNSLYYQDTDQSDDACFFYPEHVQDQTVTFRGLCDQSIPVVENFDAQQYMGTWHDIESYPGIFQTGTCRNANYDLNGNVDVLNTQVIDQALDTIRGEAVLITDDGSAKLNVTFPIAGSSETTTSQYWVLSTDYIDYALVYTCVDLVDTEERQVWAWKLSRTKQLSETASAAIDSAIAAIPVLDQRYFQSVDQSPEGCFYFPEAVPGVPVVFPGQCDETIAAVPNFDLTAFDGVWYEIEAYPKDEQGGQCINHQYSTGTGSTLNLQSSQIIDQFLTLSNGVLSFSSVDNSARMTITLSDSGIEIPFWILRTDYTDYALAYSCVNRGDDFRAIYSWKLSRTRTLSPNAITEISNAISEVEVLGEEYYETIDHSDDACFYLPELSPGEPIVIVGQCDPTISVVPNFEPARYLGRWRLVESYPSDFQDGSCNQATYSLNEDLSVDVFNTQVVNEELLTINGRAEIQDNGVLLVTFPDSPTPIEYLVLDTDYDTYALVYSCVNINSEYRRVWSWKMSRAESLPTDAIAAIDETINSINVLNNRYYQNIDQSDAACFYFPEPQQNTPIRFRGRCDQNIQVVNNFEAERYLGLWHNIELYPSVFQAGSCNNAYYSAAEDGSVDVLNTQVVGQSLETTTGFAVVAFDDGTARLNVTFPIEGTDATITTSYWVLATDYDDYSFVYTCEEEDDEYRQVYSWKLSRTKELSAPAIQAINERIAEIQVLDQRYFNEADQSSDGCFYYPEPLQGVPVVFPGQCDDSIPVVPNFDLTAFGGIWYEIQAYPKEQITGQCVSHEYTIGTQSNLILESLQVSNESLIVSPGTLSFASTDNSARLNINIVVDGEEITIPFWILDVSYNDYALAYSCVNNDDDTRSVFSWKLSRTKTLSPSADNAITSTISDIDVLGQQYFEDVDQSDEACFYYPNLEFGQPVIFPGQCDTNIGGITNFDAAAYLGRWYLVESYYTDFQIGNCNQATYSLGDNGVVEVFNTHVVDQTLLSDTGSATLSDDGTGTLFVTFPQTTTTVEYLVLDTDYTSYTLVYSCQNINDDQRRVYSWKMSRTGSLSDDATEAINQQLQNINVLDNRYFEEKSQSDEDCFYFPDPEPNTPVRFRGRCDQNIAAVDNFNAERYLGLWHNIELYPSVFQRGTCNNAFYSAAEDGSVDVLNTQVVGQNLESTTGFAVVAFDDGTARLNVTFPIEGTDETVTMSYWVLATDYDSYSLVYTCEEEDDEYRQVYSWKLSRTKELSADAEQAINERIAGIQVLDQRYYNEADQTPEGCFYFPEPSLGQPVVFPGQCDESILVVPNFDLNAFGGTWYEIQTYPKEQVQGQCVSHEYSIGTANNLILESLQVYNDTLITSQGTLTFTSTDNSARLSINIVVNGEAITIPFWILDVDYNDYALAYSCVNNDDDTRSVFSWKLSRSRTLSSTADTAINLALGDVDVLGQQYFEDVDHSDEACFYYPDIGFGEPVIFPGQCDLNIPVVQNFNAAAYLGRWYLIESYHADFQEGSCNQATYTLGDNGIVEVYNTEVVDQALLFAIGTATASPDGTGRLTVTFPQSPTSTEYLILDTDYTSYTLVYSCENINDEQRRVWSWKMSRTNSLTEEASDAINQQLLNVNVLDNRYFEVKSQSDEDCFYFPDPEPNNPVRFRGRCDQNIAAVDNFNAERYLGLWHNIELYPSVFQRGTCNNAFYSAAEDGSVDVLNTQVVSQNLESTTGFAVVAFDDGTARLNVTFPIEGTDETVTMSYWVLATDYDSYSLVYTCEEEDEEYRQVYSWKLSRTKELSADAEQIINERISGIQVLDQRYYNEADQTPQGCFYYPEPLPGVPVVFPGQCDESIFVQPEFDLAAFQGRWFEVQTYPKEQIQGQCVTHQYSPGTANDLQLQSLQVYNESLSVSPGTLSFTSSDGSARMNINIVVDGTPINIPFWILDTDYNDYALAYSCVNNEDETRSVFSWKLSRSRELSPNAISNINEVLDTVDVLGQQYFEDVDQSDEACFYLPDLNPGEAVVFPGQCDENIPAVPNFDAARYLGRWRTIQSYYSEFQGGTCGQAVYSLAEDGTVDVYNTQVIDELLDEMNGTAVVASTDNSGRLLVYFPTSPEPAIYWILATDYDTYSLVYSCRNINLEQRQVWSWKLGRERELPIAAIIDIDNVVEGINVLNDRYFEEISQTDEACFYYPEPNGGPVIFRGQCDESVEVLQDFQPASYEGIWFDLESYPQSFQSGTCPIASYTLNGDTVDVYNTQVVDQQLDVINATAVLATTDGSAKLDVTFPVAGTDLTITTPYWILDTDYDEYSLVYSCQNINDEYYRVTSWKLSRTLEFSTDAVTAINAAMSEVKELRDQYYEAQGHGDDDCFYYPDNNGGPVILDGQCEADEEIDVITNFDGNLFSGTWYEIERFPSEIQTGSCVANQYTFNQDGFTISNTIINEERLVTLTGQATISSDNRGILTVNVNDGAGVTLNGNIYILDTDYSDYALLYSCRNIDTTRKQVYSWKLGRQQSGLSDASNANIDEIVSARVDLFRNYYEATGQDNAACFYYPVFTEPQNTIVLPGPCDPSVTGMANFDAERYLGRWFEIASYPQPSQAGECNQALYSPGDGVVDVLNSQVVDRRLETQVGSAVLASANNVGILNVTFIVDDEPRYATYYVLDTDYTSFSLVYTCRDRDDGQREVFSWKLSRERSLPAASNNAIDLLVDATQGLLEDYYVPTSQSDTDCFYVPEPIADQAPRFRGRCEQYTSLMSNFEPQRYFATWWHDVERYPSENDEGECVSTRYQTGTGSTQFVETRVFGIEDGRQRTGTASGTANGRVQKTYSDGTEQILWVVATDYSSYSLVLTCEDIDDEYMRVWSAVQTSTQTLTEANQEALAPVIEANDLIYQEFFGAVAQDEGSCFYYPEQDGQRIILPGQCDADIPIQQNFNIDGYTGTWYQIERYPYPEVDAGISCVGTRYTLSDDEDVVEVVNWRADGEELATIGGVANFENGTARLTVTLNPDPENTELTVTTDIYILATDYNSYSLAYTCENIEFNQRVVVAFKLSRTRTLPASGTTAINSYMTQRRELNQQYFIQVQQNSECQDPSSSVFIKSSITIVLLGLFIVMLT